jgi:hypothetical protein
MKKSKKERIREIRKGKSNAKPSVSEEIRKYIMSNLLSVIWNASLLVGGLIFWIYFFQIQYFPDLSFAEAGLLLPVAAITGFFYLFFLTPIFMLPCLFRWLMLKQIESEPDRKDEQEGKRAVREFLMYFFSIFVLLLLIISYIFSQWILFFGIIILGLIVLFVNSNRIGFKFDRIKQGVSWFLSVFRQKKVYISLWIFTFITTSTLLNFFSDIVKKIAPIDDFNHFLYLLLFLVFIIFGNLILGHYLESFKRSWWHVFFFAIWCFIFLLFSSFPKVVMHRFHFGSYTAERFIVEGKGCKILDNMDIEHISINSEKTKDIMGDSRVCCLEKIKILSRLGHVFVLERIIDNGQTVIFNIPKKYVLSWSIPKSKEEKESGTADSAQAKISKKKKTETHPNDL